MEANILGSFYYGYMISQIPAGLLAGIVGARILFAVGIGSTALFTLLSPAAAKYSVGALIAMRVLQGVGQVNQSITQCSEQCFG